ncbi:FHIP family protein AGAP011705 [Onthophagus taurus]|uniref:FHIP family protein AGAP011705 n=1 Tax=Onthophagus taurus TaxID=166361 RepID=UPI000C208215|nr:UPF0518 protein AGAP011705 [Onthophagus taurus]
MEWLRNNGFVGSVRPLRAIGPPDGGCDPTACYDSFKEHWQQAWLIIQRNQQLPSHDDVLGVVNHLEQMVSLLVYDIKNNLNPSDCLGYLLDENLLEKLYNWSIGTGKYINAVRLEQLKLYETLLNHSRHVLLVRDSFLRPLLRLLESCQNDVLQNQSEKRLIALLYQLCVQLMQNVDLVDLFLRTEPKPKFLLFTLLINYVYRDDSIGMQARDALLLCMSLSKKKRNVADYILNQSNMDVLLVSGLGGLYSILPLVLTDVTAPDWHRLTADDVKDIKDLSEFITSLEFINAVAHVAHPDIAKGLEEFMHRGFFIPVLGPALLQSNCAEQTTAIAYLELILRTVTQPGLLYPLLQFLLKSEYDGERLLTILIDRIDSEPQLTLVSLALFESLLDLNCEDVMLELVFKYLRPCLHVMLSQRCTSFPLDMRCQSFEKLLTLSPTCCDTLSVIPKIDGRPVYQQSLYGNYHAYLYDARNKINLCQIMCSNWNNSYAGCDSSLGESSGYESLKQKIESDADGRDRERPIWQISSKKIDKDDMEKFVDDPNCLTSSDAIGPFLTVILNKLKVLLNNTIYVNLHLTGLISRLAVYPLSLLRSYLLDHSLILQPNVPSLFQIIASLKTVIDTYMLRQADWPALIEEARLFLVDRETRLVNARRERFSCPLPPVPTPQQQNLSDSDNQPFSRNKGIRRSFTSSISSISSMFNRRHSHVETSMPQQMVQLDGSPESLVYPKFTESQHVAICAVLLDEWVKELAALAQEHAVSQLTSLYK